MDGEFSRRYEPLVNAFAAGIEDGTDSGGALCVYVDGEPVVDVWGGTAAPSSGAEWTRETMCPVMSVGKAWLATCLIVLAEREQLDLDAPLTNIWPEYGVLGKEATTTRHVLAHTAGVPFHAELAPGKSWFRHADLAETLASQAPFWAPGTQPAYHPMVMGTLVDAIVRRVTSDDVATWFAREITDPLKLSISFGRPHQQQPRAFVGMSPQAARPIHDGCAPDPRCHPSVGEPRRTYDLLNSTEFEQAPWPSINGFATARGLAGFYAALITPDERRLVSPQSLAAATTPQWQACELTGGQFMRMGLGFDLGHTDSYWFGPTNSAFGHVGKGGSTGFGDHERGLAFGYVSNSHYEGPGSGPRAQRLALALAELV
jgi:CubicO group peptidase (beta-lactamase class C family)